MKKNWGIKSENVSAILTVRVSVRELLSSKKRWEKWVGFGAGLENILSWVRQNKFSADLDAGVSLSKNRGAESFSPAWL